MRVLAEHYLRGRKRVAIIDPKGDWWGLKSSQDGKGPGYPVVAFGSFKEPRATDVPINPYSGPHVAELIATANRPCVIGFRGWMPNDMMQFWIGKSSSDAGFAQTLFNKNEGELKVLIDEVHNLAPKGRTLDVQSGRSVHWTNRIMSEGRGLGLTFDIASQRSQKVHNDTLDCCETLVAMRVTHPRSREAIEEWINAKGDPALAKQVLGTLAEMKRGEAWVWSPENEFGPERVQFPMFETFDSFAPPQLQKKINQAGWSEVNLDQVKEKLASVIAEAKANDPRELRAEISRLKQELSKKPAISATTPVSVSVARARRLTEGLEAAMKIIAEITARGFEAQGITEQEIRAAMDRAAAEIARIATATAQRRVTELETMKRKAERLCERLSQLIADPADIGVSINVRPATIEPVRPAPPSRMKSEHVNPVPDGDLGKGEAIILRAIAQSGTAARDQLSVMTGYKRSTRDAYVQRLIGRSFVEQVSEGLRATSAGIVALGDGYEPLPTGSALRQHYLENGNLPEGERAVLGAAVSVYPDSVDREVVSESTGYKRSTRDAYIQRLVARKLLDSGSGPIRASKTLFD